MGEQLDIFAPPKPTKPKRARKAAPPSPCAAAPRRPDGRLWAGADRRCTLDAGHEGAHENTAGDVWAPGEVLAPCVVCDGKCCASCEFTGRADEEESHAG